MHTTGNFLAMRAHQLQYRDKNLEEAVHHLQRMRQEKKERYNKKYDIWQKKLVIGSIILLYNTRYKKNIL